MEDTRTTTEHRRDDVVGRRRFLRAAAGATVGTGAMGGLSAPALGDGPGDDGRGVGGDAPGLDRRTETRVERAIRRRSHERARRLLRERDVEHVAERVAMPAAGGGSAEERPATDDGVSVESVYDRGDSSFWMYVWSRGGDVYRAYCSWELAYSGTATIDGAGPEDGVGITVSDAEWEPVLGSWRFGPRTSLRKRGSLGVIGEFDDPDPYCDVYSCYWPEEEQRTSWMQVDLRKKRSGRHNVYGTYAHTWQSGGFWGGAGFGLSPGPISVSPDLGVDYWRNRSDQRI